MNKKIFIISGLMICLAVLGILILISGCGSSGGGGTPATIWYVSGTGSDEAAGTQAAPFRTITKALSVAQSGNLINVGAGQYTTWEGETFPVEMKNGVNLMGAGTTESLIICDAESSYAILAANAKISGFYISNIQPYGSPCRGVGIFCPGTSSIIENNLLMNCSGEAILITGESGDTIKNNLFTNNGLDGFYGGAAIYVEADNVDSLNIDGNIFTHNKGDSAIYIQEGPGSPVIKNNIITKNSSGEGDYGAITLSDGTPKLRGNIVASNEGNGIMIYFSGSIKPDMGTIADPGENIIIDNDNVGVYIYDHLSSPSTTIEAVGNIWNPVQGAFNIEGFGVYTVEAWAHGTVMLEAGNNYAIQGDHSIYLYNPTN